jgi:hypothetical protein
MPFHRRLRSSSFPGKLAARPPAGYAQGVEGRSAGTTPPPAVTSGGWRGMNGAQRRTAVIAAAGFAVVLALVLVANALSTISDLAASGAAVPDHLVWSWEWSSMAAWLALAPAIWWATGRLRAPRVGWRIALAAAVGGSAVASALHILGMVALRHVYYAATGAGPYRFFGVIGDRVLYEYRKDLVTFVQFVAIALVVRWMIDRQATPPDRGRDVPRQLVVTQGASRILVPHDEIATVAAAGNYVEVTWAGRTLLHRATLAAMERELGDTFMRIHRGLLVRVAAIRSVEVDRSGDFTVQVAGGGAVRGSRRHRDALDRRLGEVAG